VADITNDKELISFLSDPTRITDIDSATAAITMLMIPATFLEFEKAFIVRIDYTGTFDNISALYREPALRSCLIEHPLDFRRWLFPLRDENCESIHPRAHSLAEHLCRKSFEWIGFI
jgi:hypothetical protein